MAGKPRLNKAQIAAEQAFCLEKRRDGFSLRAIAALFEPHFGRSISHETINVRINDALSENPIPHLEEARAMELARYDHALNAIAPDVDQGDLGAVNTFIRLSERRAKLLGLDMPQRVEVAAIVTTPVDVALAELSAELGINDPTLGEPTVVSSL